MSQARYTISEHPQGSLEWLTERAGKVTSTGAQCVVPLSALFPDESNKRDNKAMRERYALKLAFERINGTPLPDAFMGNAWTERGTELEPLAREQYLTLHPETNPSTPGLLSLSDHPVATSPDLLALRHPAGPVAGGVEFKCPAAEKHWGWRKEGVLPREYLRQVLHHLYVVGEAEWWTFVSYTPEAIGRGQWFEVTLTRDEAQPMLEIYAKHLDAFLLYVEQVEQEVREAA
jgi:hypothetical protein